LEAAYIRDRVVIAMWSQQWYTLQVTARAGGRDFTGMSSRPGGRRLLMVLGMQMLGLGDSV
jgi:hypothetical protein